MAVADKGATSGSGLGRTVPHVQRHHAASPWHGQQRGLRRHRAETDDAHRVRSRLPEFLLKGRISRPSPQPRALRHSRGLAVSARSVTRFAANQGVGSWVERRARLSPDQGALTYGDTQRTYAELAVRVRRLAHGLQSTGVERGDRVGWLGPNHPAFLETFFASAMLGAVMTPINYRLESASIHAICAEVVPRIL